MSHSVQIITGSMLGATEYVAEELQTRLQQAQIPCELHFQPDINNIPQKGTWIICSSTHGAGDLPDNIQSFASSLPQQKLDEVRFLVIALGDSSYDTFCQAGKTLCSLMQQANATKLSDIFCIDVLEHPIPEEIAGDWLEEQIAGGLFESR